jgi:branched-chain amino acid transport system permease protein
MVVFGLAMVAIMIWRPRGLVATREPSIFLAQRKPVPVALVEEGRA